MLRSVLTFLQKGCVEVVDKEYTAFDGDIKNLCGTEAQAWRDAVENCVESLASDDYCPPDDEDQEIAGKLNQIFEQCCPNQDKIGTETSRPSATIWTTPRRHLG